MEKELWADIKGYEGIYEVSSHGNLRSHYPHNFREGDVLRSYNHNGYRRVHLCKDGKLEKFLVHRLVAEAFIPNPENKPYINHIDGNRHNNHVENLEWCTNRENIVHAVKMGTVSTANAVDAIKKPVNQYSTDGQFIARYSSCIEAKQATGATNICAVCHHYRKTSGGFVWRYE